MSPLKLSELQDKISHLLFAEYNSYAFGFFRISFYSIILWFYTQINVPHINNWLQPEMKEFFSTISFFNYFSYEDFLVLLDFDLLFWWYVSLICAALGILYPISSITSFLGFLLLAGVPLNFGKIHHVNHLPVMMLGVMAFSFYPGKLSIDGLILKLVKLKTPAVTAWPLLAARIYFCIIYLESGFQKIRHSGLEWIFSDNMQNIIVTRPTITQLGLEVAKYPLLCQFLALTTVIAQLSAPLALKNWIWRYPIVITLFFMHIGSYYIMGNHAYFFPYNLCYVIWIPWDEVVEYMTKKKTRTIHET